jgi:uncharacterized membrane protein (DUF441 family)
MDNMKGAAMTIERERLRDTAQMTLLSLLVIILIRWLTRSGIDLLNAWTFVIAAVVLAAILYASWPHWNRRRG